jgi:hypothetical protein
MLGEIQQPRAEYQPRRPGRNVRRRGNVRRHLRRRRIILDGWVFHVAIGVCAGNFIHKVVGFKIGTKVIATASVGVLVGWFAVNHFMPPVFDPMAQAEKAARNPDVYRRASLTAITSGAMEDLGERKALSMAQAQQKLPELVAAVNRKDKCYALAVSTADGGKKEYGWLRLTEATSDTLTGVETKGDPPVTKTIKNADVVDWVFVNHALGLQGGFFMPEMHASETAEAMHEYGHYRASYNIIDLLVFMAGIITVLSGQVPQLRLPFFRN